MQSSNVAGPPAPLPRSAVALATHSTAPTHGPPRHGFSDLTTTVPRQYVHRAAVSEVLLTHWETDGSDCFVAAAQWPRGHALFVQRHGRQDAMLIAETVRQVGVLLSHARFGVPLDHHFLMWDLSYAAVPGGLAAGRLPTDLTLRVTWQDLTRHGRVLSSLRYHCEVWRDATRIAVGSAGFNCTSPAVYRRVRGGRPPAPDVPVTPPVDPRLVGHADRGQVVLTDPAAAGPRAPATARPTVTDLSCRAAGRRAAVRAGRHRGRWLLRVDTAHPVFFDHPHDHVPGMLLLEGARQAAQILLGPAPVQAIAVDGTFDRFAELTEPTWIHAEAGRTDAAGNTPVTVTGCQGGRPLFTANITARTLDESSESF